MNPISTASHLVSVSLHVVVLMVALWTPVGMDLDIEADARLREWTRDKLITQSVTLARPASPDLRSTPGPKAKRARPRRAGADDAVAGGASGLGEGNVGEGTAAAGSGRARSDGSPRDTEASTRSAEGTKRGGTVNSAKSAKLAKYERYHRGWLRSGKIASQLLVESPFGPPEAASNVGARTASGGGAEPSRPTEVRSSGSTTVRTILVAKNCWRSPAGAAPRLETVLTRCTAALLGELCEHTPLCRLIAAATFTRSPTWWGAADDVSSISR